MVQTEGKGPGPGVCLRFKRKIIGHELEICDFFLFNSEYDRNWAYQLSCKSLRKI